MNHMNHEFLANEKYCPACGESKLNRFQAKNSEKTSIKEISVISCNSCDMAWQWPLMRSEEKSETYFDDMYSGPVENVNDYFDPKVRHAIADLQIDFVNELKNVPGTLLDVGSGMGASVIAAFKKGWDAFGVEPSQVGVDSGNSFFEKKRIYKGFVADLPSELLFDIVTLWDVIEHVEKPQQLIIEASSKLRQGGWLVLETGNYQSVDRIVSEMNWWAYQADHRWYFSPPSLRVLLEKAGLKNIVTSDKVFRPWFKPSSFKGPSKKQFLIDFIKAPWKVQAHILRYHELKKAALKWPKWASCPIVTVAAQRQD